MASDLEEGGEGQDRGAGEDPERRETLPEVVVERRRIFEHEDVDVPHADDGVEEEDHGRDGEEFEADLGHYLMRKIPLTSGNVNLIKKVVLAPTWVIHDSTKV